MWTEDLDKADMPSWWDRQKDRVTLLTQLYSKQKRKKLIETIERLRHEVLMEFREDLRSELLDKLQASVDELNRGVIIRSREKDILNEDKPTSYFYTLEQKRQEQSIIDEVHVVDSNNVVKKYTTRDEVMTQIYEYNKKFYSKRGINREAAQSFVDSVPICLTPQQQQIMEAIITLKEIWDAIKGLKLNKTPGPDGIPLEFYERFFELIGKDLKELYSQSVSELVREGSCLSVLGRGHFVFSSLIFA